jgi:UDP-2,4-diacetamido-2,4,6-trideoxy-beta-L-altropyranose hydrolase
MHVAFRVDASHQIGAGHVMRCLTLADALRATGAICRFVSREHVGNLNALVQARGYDVISLPALSLMTSDDAQPYAKWLGATWQDDVEQTLVAIRVYTRPHWVVVDHYALDEKWENAIKGDCERILVIDDLASRPHSADIVIDQTFGRKPEDYRALVPQNCEIRCGIEHVLLRPEFDEWRPASLARRTSGTLKKILVSLGGVDKDDISRQILLALDQCGLPTDIEVCVVLGQSSPWIAEMRQLIKTLHYKVELKVAVNNMAELLAGCDLAIGAAGTSAWERCSLGVPTIMLVLADNQREIAARLSATGAAQLVMLGPDLQRELIAAIQGVITTPSALQRMSALAAALVPCSGATLLARHMTGVFA